MEPIDGIDDAQVAAAARVVHQGCREVLSEWIRVAPIFSGIEGERTTLERGFSPEEYRLIGNIKGEPPFEGTVVHRGWKIEKISLPRETKRPAAPADSVITPAEFEIQ